MENANSPNSPARKETPTEGPPLSPLNHNSPIQSTATPPVLTTVPIVQVACIKCTKGIDQTSGASLVDRCPESCFREVVLTTVQDKTFNALKNIASQLPEKGTTDYKKVIRQLLNNNHINDKKLTKNGLVVSFP